MYRSRLRDLWGWLVLVAAGEWIATAPAAAQCVLCYASAASSGAKGIEALRMGILVLLIPAMLIFAGVIFIAVRHRNLDGAGENGSPKSGAEEAEFLPLTTGQQDHSASLL